MHCTDPLGVGGSCCVVVGVGLSQNTVAGQGRGSEFTINSNTQAASVAALSWSLCSYTSKRGSSMVSIGSFAGGKAVSLLPNAFQAGELLPV